MKYFISKKNLLFILTISFSIFFGQNPLDDYYSELPDGNSRIPDREDGYVKFTKVDGHIHGNYYEYYNNGQLCCKATLDHGKYIDTAYSYHKNGQVKSIDVFKHDTILYSQWDWYYENGQLSDSYRFNLQGLGVDISKRKHEKFKKHNFLVYDIISDRRLDFRKIQGCRYTHLSFYENGQPCFKKQTLSNKKDGEQLSYYKNGKIKSKENYIASKKQGEQFFYDTEGKSSKVCYENESKVPCDELK